MFDKLFNNKSARSRGVAVVGSNAFGGLMSLEEVKGGFVKADDTVMWRAMGQMMLALREQCVQQSKVALQGEKLGLAAFHAGGEDVCVNMAHWLVELSEGRVPEVLKEWFPEKR